MRRAGRLLRGVCCAALCAAVAITGAPLAYDPPLPAVVRICVMIYPPFVLERVRRRVAAGASASAAQEGLCAVFSVLTLPRA
jgi:hypothetical protein